MEDQLLRVELLKLAAQIVQPASNDERAVEITRVASRFLAWSLGPNPQPLPDGIPRKD